jgi:hypothetical protein
MNFIISIIKNIKSKELPIYLGRWKIEYCNVKINNTIKLANEDHCGACSQYTVNNINITDKQNEIKGIFNKIIT